MLLDECAKGGVDLRCGDTIRAVEQADGVYRVSYGDRTAQAPALVLATGAPSIPKLGAPGFSYTLEPHFGHQVVQPPTAAAHVPRHTIVTLFPAVSAFFTDH